MTDDSDVFLFGGSRIYRNMFNDNKYVECYLLTDLERELGLDRDKLVALSYLLGGDYAEGIQGVGPVSARELLEDFRGEDPLKRFKEWWLKVEAGKDGPEDTATPFRRKFVSFLLLLSLQLSVGLCLSWLVFFFFAEKGTQEPRARQELAGSHHRAVFLARVRPSSKLTFFPSQSRAYYHPAVNDDNSPFTWGGPDLDGLRTSVLFSRNTCLSNPDGFIFLRRQVPLQHLVVGAQQDGRGTPATDQEAERAQERLAPTPEDAGGLVRYQFPYFLALCEVTIDPSS